MTEFTPATPSFGCGIVTSAYCDLLNSFLRELHSVDASASTLATVRFLQRGTRARRVAFLYPGAPTIEWPPQNRQEDGEVPEYRRRQPSNQPQERSARIVRLRLPQRSELEATLEIVEAQLEAGPAFDELVELATISLSAASREAALQQLVETRNRQVVLLQQIVSLSRDAPGTMWERLLDLCEAVLPTKHSVLWLVDQRTRRLVMRRYRTGATPLMQTSLDIDGSLTGQAYLQNKAVHFSDSAPEWKDLFQSPAKAAALDLRSVVIIPIRGDRSGSRDGILAILALFPAGDTFAFDSNDFDILSTEVGAALTLARDAERDAIVREIGLAAQKSSDAASYLHRAGEAIRDALKVEAVSIFGWKEATHRLALAASTGHFIDMPLRPEIYYAPTEGLTGRVFATGNELLLDDQLSIQRERGGVPAKFTERTEHAPHSLMAVPVRGVDRSGRSNGALTPIGVVRCVNKLSYIGEHVERFLRPDLDLLKFATEIMAPYLELFRAEARRASLLSRVSHEILTPVNSIRGTVENLLDGWDRMPIDKLKAQVRNISTDASILRMLCGGILATQVQPRRPSRTGASCAIIEDVIAPCVDMVKPASRGRGLRFDAIRVEGPARTYVTLDKLAVQQILFNLLTNAVKYHRKRARSAFAVRVTCSVDENGYEIGVADMGVGVDDADAPHLFDYGFRGHGMHVEHSPGMGLGLFIAATLADRIGATLRLMNKRNPTEFILTGPKGSAADPEPR